MKHVLLLVVLSLGAATLPSAATAQSLAEVARKEEARRKAVKVPGKVYTNIDLKPDPSKGSAPGPGTASPGTRLEPVPTPTPVPVSVPGAVPEQPVPGEGEAYWKALITGARGALERSKVLSDALQSRLNALATDIVNRDDPAQRAQLELERQRALAELDRMKTDIAEQTKTIADIEEDARKAGVPPGWLR